MADTTLRSVADGFDAASQHIASSAEELGQQAADAIKSGQNSAARILDGTANYFRNKNAKDMLSDLQAQAKTNPAAFLIGALALGFVAGRLLRRG